MFASMARKGLLGGMILSLPVSMALALPAGFNQKVLFSGMDMVSSEVLPDGRVLAVEKIGKVSLLNQKTGVKSVALDMVSGTWSNYEAGMTQVLHDPDFATNGYLYIQYCKKAAVNNEDHDWVSRFKMTGDVIDPASETKILDGGFRGPNYHHGSGMAIKDGFLYIAVGSRRNSGNSNQPDQAGKTSVVFGKIHRVKIPDGEIPADNPFYAANTGDAKAVYYYGLRNPFTMSIHPTTGKLWWTDVQDGSGDDEINEGGAPGSGYGYGGGNTGALFSADDADCGGGAMVGSLWYTGNNFPAEYKDKYFFGQVRGCGSNLKYTDAGHSSFTAFGPFNVGNESKYSPIDIKMDGGGAIYVSTRYQTENAKATAGQVIKVWYGDTEPEIPGSWAHGMARAIISNKLKWTGLPGGGLALTVLQEGAQTIELCTLDGRALATRSVSGKGQVEFATAARGLHVLTWTAGNVKTAVKVML
jgi:glucose/arabinose dehydrogenase